MKNSLMEYLQSLELNWTKILDIELSLEGYWMRIINKKSWTLFLLKLWVIGEDGCLERKIFNDIERVLMKSMFPEIY